MPWSSHRELTPHGCTACLGRIEASRSPLLDGSGVRYLWRRDCEAAEHALLCALWYAEAREAAVMAARGAAAGALQDLCGESMVGTLCLPCACGHACTWHRAADYVPELDDSAEWSLWLRAARRAGRPQ